MLVVVAAVCISVLALAGGYISYDRATHLTDPTSLPDKDGDKPGTVIYLRAHCDGIFRPTPATISNRSGSFQADPCRSNQVSLRIALLACIFSGLTVAVATTIWYLSGQGGSTASGPSLK